MIRLRSRLLILTCLWVAPCCVPVTSAYLSVPVESQDGTTRRAVELCVSLDELDRHMRDLDPDTLTFYAGGREPIPHQLIDEDGDGEPDAAVIVMPVAGDGSTRLTALSPGPPADGPLLDGEFADGVVLRFDRARR